jgi:hypothetical protein
MTADRSAYKRKEILTHEPWRHQNESQKDKTLQFHLSELSQVDKLLETGPMAVESGVIVGYRISVWENGKGFGNGCKTPVLNPTDLYTYNVVKILMWHDQRCSRSPCSRGVVLWGREAICKPQSVLPTQGHCCGRLMGGTTVTTSDLEANPSTKDVEDKEKPGMMVHACNPGYLGGRSRRILSSRPARAKLVRPYLKNKI